MVILDNLIYGHRDLVEKVLQVELVVGDASDRAQISCYHSQAKNSCPETFFLLPAKILS